MGVVYNPGYKTSPSVALKFPSGENVARSAGPGPVRGGSTRCAALSHPNICTIHEIHDERDTPFIEMEYVEGRTLKARLNSRSRLRLWTLHQSRGAEEAHQRGHSPGLKAPTSW
jgi:serine/threonine protein kinase